MTDELNIRELASEADYAACLELQMLTWGSHFSERVPATILKIAQKMGGIAAGAFEGGQLVGFVFGITGLRDGAVAHWSDMLAVRPSHRNRGIGEKLKQYQRAILLERGVPRIYWTFDPLDARNAHLNFNRLGVCAREYVIDMYGNTGSDLHVTGTDRLIVTWQIDRPRRTWPAERHIDVPLDIHDIARADPAAAMAWRERTRAQFREMLPSFVVTGFERLKRTGRYALTSASNFAA